MVESLADYRWSSYAHHALGRVDNLISEHDLYQALGKDSVARCDANRALLDGLDMTQKNEAITQATDRGEVYGSDAFHQRIDKMITRPTRLVVRVAR